MADRNQRNQLEFAKSTISDKLPQVKRIFLISLTA